MINRDHWIYLRVIAGSLKGRKFDAPKGGKTVRPIGDRVKEALFSILHSKTQDAMVLDLFSGTGAIGIEALSRGARKVVYVEKDPRNVRLIQQNTQKLGITDQIQIQQGVIPEVLNRMEGQFDLVFIDPPFATELVDDILQTLKKQRLINKNSLMVIQRFRGSVDISSSGFEVQRKHRVGDSILWFMNLYEE